MNYKKLEQELKKTQKQVNQLKQMLARALVLTSVPNEFFLCEIESLSGGKFVAKKKTVDADRDWETSALANICFN